MTTLEQNPAGNSGNIWTSYSTRDRVLLTAGAIVAFLIFHFIGRAFRIPELQDFQASLLGNPSPVATVLIAAITFFACVLIGSLIAGSVHFEGGLFCACVGLVSLSTRGGSMRYELMSTSSPGVWVRMLIETAVLLGIVAAGWYLLKQLRESSLLRGENDPDEEEPDAMPGQGLLALAAQVVGMIILMLVLTQSDQKAQVIWSIAIAAWVSAFATHQIVPIRSSVWFWTAPFIVAGIGYLCAMFSGPALPGGQVPGMLSALARPMPLDYAAIGPAAAMFGYWTSRKWHAEHEEREA